MPTYDYVCRSCGHTFEAFQSMLDQPMVTCPQCAEPSLKRLVGSGAGLIFKGSGFYITDYKKSPGGNKEAAGEAKAGGGEGKTGGGEGKTGGGEGKSDAGKAADGKPDGKKSSSDSKPGSDSKATTRPSSPKE
jgi:putative FmdB family regulatory protein